MKVVLIIFGFANLGLSQILRAGGEPCGSGESCLNFNETSALVCEYAILMTRIDEKQLYRNTEVKPNGFPHMAAIGYPATDFDSVDWLCSGTLITRKHILTVAHCLEITDGRKAIWVRLGDTDLRNGGDDFNAQTHPVRKCYKHPQYSVPQRYNDIGIIQIEGKVTIVSDFVEPACLPMSSFLPEEVALVTDWGKLPGQTSSDAREYGLARSEHEFLPIESCNQSYSVLSVRNLQRILPQGLSKETMICAKSLVPSNTSCVGTSGGALQLEVNKDTCAYTVVGITSFGFGCNKVNEPTIYTNVYPYLSWIQDIVCR